MKITKENYELFLIDYLDDNLGDLDKEELFDFLAKNQSISEEFELLKAANSLVNLIEEPKDKLDFSYLKKEEENKIPDEEIIAFMEGDLNEIDKALVQRKLILYPQNKANYDLFLKTKLPQENIHFEHKESLKKKTGLLVSLKYNYIAIAAVFLAFALFGILYFGDSQLPKDSFVENNNSNILSEPNALKSKELASVNSTTIGYPVGKGKLKNSKSLNSSEPKVKDLNGSNFNRVQNKVFQKELDGYKGNLKVEKSANLAKDITKVENQIAKEMVGEETKKTEIQKVENPSPVKNEIGSDLANTMDVPFLKPSEWVKEKMKARIPQTITVLDTLKEGGVRLAGNYAKQLVERTTGISYQEKRDPNNERNGFSIISKYFAYERSY